MKYTAIILLLFFLTSHVSHDPVSTQFIQIVKNFENGSSLKIVDGEPVQLDVADVAELNKRTVISNLAFTQTFNNVASDVQFGLPVKNEHNFTASLDEFTCTEAGNYAVKFSGLFYLVTLNRTSWYCYITVNDTAVGIKRIAYSRGASNNRRFSFDFEEELNLSAGDRVSIAVQRESSANISARAESLASLKLQFKKSAL